MVWGIFIKKTEKCKKEIDSKIDFSLDGNKLTCSCCKNIEESVSLIVEYASFKHLAKHHKKYIVCRLCCKSLEMRNGNDDDDSAIDLNEQYVTLVESCNVMCKIVNDAIRADMFAQGREDECNDEEHMFEKRRCCCFKCC